MTTSIEYAQLSLYVYQTRLLDNKINLPIGWELAEPLHPDNMGGFSYGVFRRIGTSEIALVFTGSNEKLATDYLLTNFPAGLGLPSFQISNAALAYQQVLQNYGVDSAGSNITLSGHSLGGGLASVMATWFNRPAVVFDEAPFQLTAANPVLLAATRAFLFLHGYTNAAMDNAVSDFAIREQQVQNYYLQGELLADLRSDLNTVGNSAPPILANVTDISTSVSDKITLHSQALLTAMLVSDAFRLATFASTRVIPLLMDESFYAYDTATSDKQNVLIKFIRSEQGTGDILTHFAADLNKLGTNIAGLNLAAQNALIAQGIEWYYWQGPNYPNLPRQEFFIQTANLYQYTTAQGDHLEGARNKAASYVDQWLTPLLNANNAFGGNVNYDQSNVVAGDTGATATAKDPSKSQIYVGGGGADSFTGGNLGDILLAGAGNDSLNGGLGNDQLYGGAGQDSYLFSGAWGNDTLTDSDGSGSIRIGTASSPALTGGKKLLDNVWESDDHSIIYTLTGTAGNQNLIIGQRTTPSAATVSGTITVQGWVNGQLGINLDSAFAAQTPNIPLFNGDQRAPLSGTSYNWAATSGYDAAGNLIGGVAELNFADVIYGSATADKITGLGGNDALDGGAGDFIDAGAGNDYVVASYGADWIEGGTGNDKLWGLAGNDVMDVGARIALDNRTCAIKRTNRHYKNRSCLCYVILGLGHKRYVKKSGQSRGAGRHHDQLVRQVPLIPPGGNGTYVPLRAPQNFDKMLNSKRREQ
jgi:Ca2+-binding RTX toxin-like protein